MELQRLSNPECSVSRAPRPLREFDQRLVSEPNPFSGNIQQVYQTAAWVELSSGYILTLLDTSRDLVPFGIKLPLRIIQPTPQSRLEFFERQMVLTGLDGKSRAFFLEGPGYSLCLPTRSPLLKEEILQKQLSKLYLPRRTRALMGETKALASEPNGMQRQALIQAGSQMRLLATMLCRNVQGPISFREVLSRLIGLGPGQTPTGDDLLVGVAACALRFAAAGWLNPESVESYFMALKSHPVSTTRLSREMIRHAVERSFSAPLLDLVGSLGNPLVASGHAELATQTLSRMGEQSGSDQLASVLYLSGELLKDRKLIKDNSSFRPQPSEIHKKTQASTLSVWRR